MAAFDEGPGKRSPTPDDDREVRTARGELSRPGDFVATPPTGGSRSAPADAARAEKTIQLIGDLDTTTSARCLPRGSARGDRRCAHRLERPERAPEDPRHLLTTCGGFHTLKGASACRLKASRSGVGLRAGLHRPARRAAPAEPRSSIRPWCSAYEGVGRDIAAPAARSDECEIKMPTDRASTASTVKADGHQHADRHGRPTCRTGRPTSADALAAPRAGDDAESPSRSTCRAAKARDATAGDEMTSIATRVGEFAPRRAREEQRRGTATIDLDRAIRPTRRLIA